MTRDLCTAGLWDIVPTKVCPICGAAPDARCLGTLEARVARLFGTTTTTRQEKAA